MLQRCLVGYCHLLIGAVVFGIVSTTYGIKTKQDSTMLQGVANQIRCGRQFCQTVEIMADNICNKIRMSLTDLLSTIKELMRAGICKKRILDFALF